MKLKGVERKQIPGFTVIGKEGNGQATEADSWVPLLWDQLNQHFEELAGLIDASQMENLHLWGLMSDKYQWLAPWQKEGRYLAGVQVKPDAIAPAGWIKWQMPPLEFLTIRTSGDKIDQATQLMLGDIFDLEKVELAGAVQEHYLPSFSENEVELYFPIEERR